MLQLQTNTINVCRIGKLLAKYNIKASITDSLITLDGDIPDNLLTQLCNEISINFITNFVSNEPLPENTSCVNSEEIENESKVEAAQICSDSSKFDLIYPEVRRGEVYECDFGTPHGSEQGFLRYAIVIQNNLGNEFSPTTIVIACSTEPKKDLPVHLSCKFSSKNMPDYSFNRLETFENVIMAEQIRTVDKTRLRRYIGFLTPEFMEQIEEKIYISLDLKPKETIVEKEVFVDKIVEKIVYVDKIVPLKEETDVKPQKEQRKDLNMVQVQLLSFVNINELIKISQSKSTDEIKAKKILELFNFDFTKKGVEYLLKAIIASPKTNYFNLETLSDIVSKEENDDKDEIKRLIVARVKENFGFRKAPTIDFIRLINNFLSKQEDNYEENNI